MPSSPSGRSDRLRRLIALPFAHRGLHGPGIIENSRAAFAAAIAAGHGIELDVQPSAEGTAFVFHDDRLDRLADASGPVAEQPESALRAVRLRDSEETITPLSEVLQLIAGRAPLLVEVKSQPPERLRRLCEAVRRDLADYAGPVAIMSFNPRVGAWFACEAPSVLRGLVVTEQGKGDWRGPLQRRAAFLWARPDFLAYDVRDLPSRFAAAIRGRGVPILTWTVRREEDRLPAAAHADQIIYENSADG
jgi:glycerophosphoryl diester phosphodiesterase